MVVPSDSSTPAGKAAVLTGLVLIEEGVVGPALEASKSTSRFFNHWDVWSGWARLSAEEGRLDTAGHDKKNDKTISYMTRLSLDDEEKPKETTMSLIYTHVLVHLILILG